MFSLSRSLLRWGIIGGLALGGVAVLIGPDRVAAAFDQVRSSARSAADRFVEDPVALRRQLSKLAEQYPERIGQIRSELAQVERQLRQLEQDNEVAKRVVAMTTADLDRIRVAVSGGEGSERLVGLDGIDARRVEAARDEARRINQVRLSYQDRFAGNTQQLEFLGQQKERLSKILSRIEGEYAQFESKMAVLDRQIDSIARNERLIEMTKSQQALLSDYDKLGQVGNLGQLEARLTELRTVQEAQLQALSKAGIPDDYEQRAKAALSEDRWNEADPLSGFPWSTPAAEPTAEPTPRNRAADTKGIASRGI